MEDIKKLYPLKFLPIAETFDWGGEQMHIRYSKSFVVADDKGNEKKLPKGVPVAESHELADLGYRDSQVREGWLAGNSISELMDTYLDRLVGEDPFAHFGRQFPVGVKFIDATGRIPLMVCPDDNTARSRYDFLGKTKLWYVVDAKEGAQLFIGFKQDISSSDFYSACISGDMEKHLNVITPHKGDSFIITPGEVHSAAGGVLLLEVSQASPLDFCLTGWGKELPEGEFDPALNFIEALDFVNLRKHLAPARPSSPAELANLQQFKVSRIELKDPAHIFGAQYGCFLFYSCVEGEFSVRIGGENEEREDYIVRSGESVLLPAEVEDFYLLPRTMGTTLLEITLPLQADRDGYIDPEAEEKLKEESLKGEEEKEW